MPLLMLSPRPLPPGPLLRSLDFPAVVRSAEPERLRRVPSADSSVRPAAAPCYGSGADRFDAYPQFQFRPAPFAPQSTALNASSLGVQSRAGRDVLVIDQGAPWQHAASEAALLQPPQAAWSNPLLSALPYAPNLKIHCLYGVGLPTERGYAVRDVGPDTAEAPALAIDRGVNGLGANGVAVSNGVLLTDGDGMEP